MSSFIAKCFLSINSTVHVEQARNPDQLTFLPTFVATTVATLVSHIRPRLADRFFPGILYPGGILIYVGFGSIALTKAFTVSYCFSSRPNLAAMAMSFLNDLDANEQLKTWPARSLRSHVSVPSCMAGGSGNAGFVVCNGHFNPIA